jgi:hypothetical protein
VAPETEHAVRERGKTAITQAFSILSSNLTAALSQGGPTNALPFCSVKAGPLTASAAPSADLEVRRVSHKARNPKNKATDTEFAVLQRFHAAWQHGEKPSPVVATNASGNYVFYAPIGITNAICLVCHGRLNLEVQPETMALVRTLYPDDQATGFTIGDLRGMWAVEIRRDAVAPPK